MASSKWKSWEEIAELTRDRKVVFWGASNWVERTIERIEVDSLFVVDNSKFNQGIVFAEHEVKAPSALLETVPRPYVIITTSQYKGVINELHDMEFVMGEDFCCSPLMNERRNKDRLNQLDRQILVSSSQHTFDDTTGGGLYVVDTLTGNSEKVYSGKCRGVAHAGSDFAVVDMLGGLMVFDENFKIKKTIEFDANSEPHGLCYAEDRNAFFVGLPGRDAVACYSAETGEKVQEFSVSKKWQKNHRDNHHVNDPCYFDGSLFVSMFSLSGNWLSEVHDGCIVEFDVDSGEMIGPAVNNLWMPHSVHRFDGRLYYLNSMLGELRTMGHVVIGKFAGFMRGMDFSDGYFALGTTAHSYPELLVGESNNISLDNGFHIFDPVSKMSRFLRIPGVEIIHDLLWI